ncbi:sialoadhesin-like isoform X2 [Chelmon rostratus]|uniref:sialoadhesin-like isoform X2 n=1 Tax=Chelmon rostratus TaxID=109905 RepID=UPI001BE726CE|nr:sialoadhesin-like isoform X2 [Chelmon rostratus]
MGHTLTPLFVLGLILLNTLLCGHAEGQNYDDKSADDGPDYADMEKRPTAVATLQSNWPDIYEGERIALRCEIKDGGDAEWEYRWLTSSSQTSSYNPHIPELSISFAYVSHSGYYRCMGTMKSGQQYRTEWSDYIKLTVSGKPRSVLTASPSWLSPGGAVTLNCEAERPSAGWRFSWYKAVPKLSDTSYSYEPLPGSSNGTEQDSFVVHGQTGTAGYACRAGRGDPVYYTYYSEPMFVFSGDPHPSSSLTVSPDGVQHFTSGSVSLNCEGNSSRWRVRRVPQNTASSYLSSCPHWGTMTGSTCSLDRNWHAGAAYWCESGSGEFSNAVNITIQNENIILLSPARPVTEGDAVSLSCKLRRGEFGSVVLFYRNGELIQNDTTRELKIPAVSKSDEGMYKCQHSRDVSPQSWMSVKVSRPESASFPVLLIVGLVCAILLMILLLLLYQYRVAKDPCFIRPIQPESTNQGSDTNHVVNQSEAQCEKYSALLHGDTHLYDSVERSEDTDNDADGPKDVTYSLIELKNIREKGNKRESEEDQVYPDGNLYAQINHHNKGKGRKKGQSPPGATDETVYSEVKPGTALGNSAAT